MASELCVLGFVGVLAEAACADHPGEEVRIPDPRRTWFTCIEECRLVDDIDPGCQGSRSLVDPHVQWRDGVDGLDNKSTRLELAEIGGFMLEAATLEDCQFGVLRVGSYELAPCHGQRKSGQVGTVEVADKVARAENDPTIFEVHPAPFRALFRCANPPTEV